MSITALAGISILFASAPVRRFLAPQGGSDLGYDQSLDPAVGSTIDLPLSDGFGGRIFYAPRTVLVIAGGCTSCSLHAIDPREIVPVADTMYLFAYQSSLKDLPAWMRTLHGPVRIVADERRRLQRAANSVWQPRVVVLDADRKVVELSHDPADALDNFLPRRRR